MNLTRKRIIRFLLATLLPVPMFVGLYYSSYFYASFYGFDHETKSYLTGQRDIAIARQHLRTDVIAFLGFGYYLMGIPSVVYAILLERHRTSSRFGIPSYVGLGALMGALSGSLAACFRFVLTDGAYDFLLVVLTSTAVGGIIPVLLLVIAPQHENEYDRDHHPKAPTADPVATEQRDA